MSVFFKDASTGNRTSNLLITKRLLYHCTTVALQLDFRLWYMEKYLEAPLSPALPFKHSALHLTCEGGLSILSFVYVTLSLSTYPTARCYSALCYMLVSVGGWLGRP